MTQVITWAFVNGKRFGHDVIYTYGLLGFLAFKLYTPSTFPLVLGFTLVLGVTLGLSMAAVLSRLPSVERVVVASLVIWGLVVQAETVFFLAGLLLVILGVQGASRYSLALSLLLASLMAVAALAKQTVLVLGLVAVVSTDGYRLLSSRRWPAYTVVFVATGLAAWLAAGQPLTGLSEYLRSGFEVVRGYDRAVQLHASLTLPLIYAGAACITLVPLAFHVWNTRDRPMALLVAFGAFELFIAFKHGFVRADGHKSIAFGGSLIIASMLVASPRPPFRPRTLRALLTMLVVLAMVWATDIYGRPHTFVNEKARGLATILSGRATATYSAQFEQAMDRIRREIPLPRIRGTVDVYGWHQVAALANGLNYRPRPVFQGYLAHTQPLIDLNLAHLKSDRAAHTLLFDVGSIDDRYPSLDDGALWPEIISRYRHVGTTPHFLVLERRADPLAISMTEIARTRVPHGTEIVLSGEARAIWAKFHFTETAAGKLITTGFRPPIIKITVQLVTGEESEYRLVPAMASAGFLLSPLIETREHFSALLNGNLPALESRRVHKVTIRSTAALRLVYDEAVSVALFTMRIGSPAAKTVTSIGAESRR